MEKKKRRNIWKCDIFFKLYGHDFFWDVSNFKNSVRFFFSTRGKKKTEKSDSVEVGRRAYVITWKNKNNTPLLWPTYRTKKQTGVGGTKRSEQLPANLHFDRHLNVSGTATVSVSKAAWVNADRFIGLKKNEETEFRGGFSIRTNATRPV